MLVLFIVLSKTQNIYFKYNILNYLWIIASVYTFEFILLILEERRGNEILFRQKINVKNIANRRIYYILKYIIVGLFLIEVVSTVLLFPFLRQHKGIMLSVIPSEKEYIPKANGGYYLYNTRNALIVCKDYGLFIKELAIIRNNTCPDCQCTVVCDNYYNIEDLNDSLMVTVYQDNYRLNSVIVEKVKAGG